ncbi:MAG: DUF3500 domain-containing protein [Ilumatobacteraceae bacterium]
MTRAVASAMADIANELLGTLDADQRAVAQWRFPSDEERRLWFYTPTDHGGLTLHGLIPAQHRLVMRLVDSVLSRPGYVTVSTVMGLENVLDQLEGWGAMWNFPRGRDPQRYFLRFFGDPGSDAWGWRIGGHHISLNITVCNDEVASSTPCFLGADPAASPLLGGQLLRPLAGCEDLARDLLAAFDDDQRRIAIVADVPPVDLVGANRARLSDGDRPLRLAKVWRDEFTGELRDVVERIQDTEEEKIGLTEQHLQAVEYTTAPKGLAAAHMRGDQRNILEALVGTYLDRVRDEVAAAEWERVREHFELLHFAWAGSTERGLPHYYRIQGPRLLAEYDNTTRDGNHVHTVWRDPINDFGVDALGDHHRHGH